MSLTSIEKRLNALEQRVAELQALTVNGTHGKNWRRTIGIFKGDDVMQEILQEALNFREQDRALARDMNKARRAAK